MSASVIPWRGKIATHWLQTDSRTIKMRIAGTSKAVLPPNVELAAGGSVTRYTPPTGAICSVSPSYQTSSAERLGSTAVTSAVVIPDVSTDHSAVTKS